MADPFVTLPGTAGNYLATDDINLLDADSAHLYQSLGYCAYGTATISIAQDDEAVAFSGKAVKVTHSANTCHIGQWSLAGDATGAVAASPSDEITLSCRADTIDATNPNVGLRVRMFALDSGGSVVEQFNGTSSALSTTAVTLSVTGTMPASTAFVGWWIGTTGTVDSAPSTWRVWDLSLRRDSSVSFVPSLRIVGDAELAIVTDQTNVARVIDVYFNAMRLQWNTSSNLYAYFTTAAGVGQAFTTSFPSSAVKRTIKATRVKATGATTLSIDGESVATATIDAGAALVPTAAGLIIGDSSVNRQMEANVWEAFLRDGIGGPIVAHFAAADVAGAI